jgi:hypothetical protein
MENFSAKELVGRLFGRNVVINMVISNFEEKRWPA